MQLGGETDVWVGRRFGSYRIDDVLGRGAVATAYRALSSDDRTVALKVLTPFAEAQREVRRLFEQEWEITRRLDHPNLVHAYRYGEYRDSHFLEMELLEGPTIGDELAPSRRMDPATAVDLAAQVADGLGHVHERRIVHRDVKPGNVVHTAEGRAVLFDFGLALDLDGPPPPPGRVFGSPFWLSPEQARSEEIDGRADIYGLGATLFRMVCGRAPFYGERSDLLRSHVEEPPPVPSQIASVPEALSNLILRAMAKDRNDRPGSADEFAAELRSLDLEPVVEGRRRGLGRLFRR